MMLKALIAALLALPPYYPERDKIAERDAFLAELAPSIIREAKGDRELAAFVIAIGWHETKFSPRLARSECRPRECDPRRFTLPGGRKVVQHQSRGAFQLQRVRTQTEAEWAALIGPGSFDAQVREATRRARGALGMCRDKPDAVARAFNAYAGAGCSLKLPDSAERAKTFASVRARLQ